MLLNAFALAVAPGIAIMLAIYALDQRNREPLGLLIRCFLLGVLSVAIPLAVQTVAAMQGWRSSGGGLLQTTIYAFIIVGLSEEGGKFLVLRYFAYPKKAFDEPFDGIVYSIMIGMGFATAENISYVYQFGMATGWARMFISVPAHACFAILMGYYTGLAKFIPQHRGTLLLTGLFWAVMFHGAFDFFLFIGDSIFQVVAALLCLYIAVRLSIRAIRQHRATSREWDRLRRENENQQEQGIEGGQD
ncbi:PrsW family glutamic-type intramembrane protease [Chitinophaga sp.]|uniref:PrsW family intramembrane metalloprotease n=1 Tax=Chitinophaga sp. TaxID=1869181 RepID=UPI002612A2D4|nr:PrsW family glutamic-type intramembrane protease [uncultured Chitinophaga sp.]